MHAAMPRMRRQRRAVQLWQGSLAQKKKMAEDKAKVEAMKAKLKK